MNRASTLEMKNAKGNLSKIIRKRHDKIKSVLVPKIGKNSKRDSQKYEEKKNAEDKKITKLITKIATFFPLSLNTSLGLVS